MLFCSFILNSNWLLAAAFCGGMGKCYVQVHYVLGSPLLYYSMAHSALSLDSLWRVMLIVCLFPSFFSVMLYKFIYFSLHFYFSLSVSLFPYDHHNIHALLRNFWFNQYIPYNSYLWPQAHNNNHNVLSSAFSTNLSI